ncbi:MAG: hypothetical protein HZA93_05360 [Verrucomicrobia bacterium]|nr:hypothetical protein [Verrucomicrobiota bacterium]
MKAVFALSILAVVAALLAGCESSPASGRVGGIAYSKDEHEIRMAIYSERIKNDGKWWVIPEHDAFVEDFGQRTGIRRVIGGLDRPAIRIVRAEERSAFSMAVGKVVVSGDTAKAWVSEEGPQGSEISLRRDGGVWRITKWQVMWIVRKVPNESKVQTTGLVTSRVHARLSPISDVVHL